VEESVRVLEEVVRANLDFPTAPGNLALVLRHWLFDDEGAAAHEAHAVGIAPPQLSQSVLDGLLFGGAPEDAAPRATPLPDAASESAPNETESTDDAQSK
jgi:hypothetical protein